MIDLESQTSTCDQASDLSTIVSHLEKLIACDTQNPPRHIQKNSDIFAYLQSQLVGFEFEFYDAGEGCIALLASRGQPDLLFNFHIDTVPVASGWHTNPHQLTVTDEKAFGLGACDIKGAAACMLLAAQKTTGELALLFSSDEEFGQSLAIKHFLANNQNFKQVVVAEPTQAKAVLAHRGIQSAQIRFSGISGHASEARALRDNAIHKASRWATKALDWVSEQHFEFESLQGLPFNIGKIEGGIKANMIAADCTAAFGFRPLPGQNAKELLTQFHDLAIPKSDSQMIVGFNGPTLPADNQPFTESIKRATILAEQLDMSIGGPVSFWTEASLFSQAGMTAIVYGPGDIAQAHTANEWVALSQLTEVAAKYQSIINNNLEARLVE